MWYDVKLIYQNIESGGSSRYKTVYKIEADNKCEAIKRGIRRLGSNLDGKLFSSSARQISRPRRRINYNNIPCSED